MRKKKSKKSRNQKSSVAKWMVRQVEKETTKGGLPGRVCKLGSIPCDECLDRADPVPRSTVPVALPSSSSCRPASCALRPAASRAGVRKQLPDPTRLERPLLSVYHQALGLPQPVAELFRHLSILSPSSKSPGSSHWSASSPPNQTTVSSSPLRHVFAALPGTIHFLRFRAILQQHSTSFGQMLKDLTQFTRYIDFKCIHLMGTFTGTH